MHIIINNSSMIPIYEQLMEQIKKMIISGELACGELLPSVRGLSGELKISALTVKKAYDRLEEAGLITTVHGKGSFVSQTNKELAIEAERKNIEDEFAAVVEKARMAGMENRDIYEIVKIILED